MSHTFQNFNLKPFMHKALDVLGFEEPTEIQAKVIPLVQEGKDIIGQSYTGSGKTHAFLLPILNEIESDRDEVQAVIAAPSRELARQIYDNAIEMLEGSDEEIRVQLYVGGTDKLRQQEQLENRQPQVVIGTPGRMADLMSTNHLAVYTSKYFVVDEADMTFDMGFLKQVDQLAGAMPKDLQMLVFSATIPQQLQPFLKKYMNQPEYIQLDRKEHLAPSISNWLLPVKSRDRNKLIYEILTVGHPYFVLIFANTRTQVVELATYLENQGLKVGQIHGDLSPRERKREMRRIQALEYQYVVATDLAARGIDIEGVSHVINAEIPNELEFFVHRVGRTGRNGMDGIAITLYHPDEEGKIQALEQKGIVFEEKDLRNGTFVDTKIRNEREKRRKPKVETEFDPQVNRLIQKGKKKVKPGYKKKIQRRLKQNRRKKR